MARRAVTDSATRISAKGFNLRRSLRNLEGVSHPQAPHTPSVMLLAASEPQDDSSRGVRNSAIADMSAARS